MTAFAACLSACGLTLDDAAVVLGQSRSTVSAKSRGARAMTPADAVALGRLWSRIRLGDTEGLPEGAAEMAAALRILRGVEGIAPARRGRPKRADPG